MYVYDAGISEWLIGFGVLAVLLVILWRQKRSPWQLLFFSCFWLYLLLLVNATLFPVPMDIDFQVPGGFQSWQYTLQQVNLIPFKYLVQWDVSPGAIFSEILNNILLTVPLGFGINFLAHVKPRKIIWIAGLAGLSIELAQLILSLIVGHPFRTVDITDVILNTTGTLFGYVFFRIIAWLHRLGLGAYLDEIAQR